MQREDRLDCKMSSKRNGNHWPSNDGPTPKRTKLDNKPVTNSSQNFVINDDDWGDLDEENAIENLDFIVSQEFMQDASANDFIKPQNPPPKPSSSYSNPSTSNGFNNNKPVNKNNFATPNSLTRNVSENVGSGVKPISRFNNFESQVLAGSSRASNANISGVEKVNYEEFKKIPHANSTQNKPLLNSSIQNSQSFTKNQLSEREAWALDKKKTTEKLQGVIGEKMYFEKQWKKVKEEQERQTAEFKKKVEELEAKHKAETAAYMKEKEEMKTQLELNALDYEKLNERFKHLEAGDIRLVRPQASFADVSIRNKSLNSTFCRPDLKSQASPARTPRVPVNISMKPCVFVNDCPLKNIPRTVMEPSTAEKSIVTLKRVEKSGRRNLPILEEDESLKILDHPELIKPLVTTVGDVELNRDFYFLDLMDLTRKNEAEINSIVSIPIINKIVATTRELLLYVSLVLEKLSNIMTNDDIRDMNETYLSDLYKTPVSHSKTIFDGQFWHEEERAIEARRSVAALSHIASNSTYLSEYISGKGLVVEHDTNYQTYVKQMRHFKCWPLKNSNCEFLQLLLKFVTALRIVRRSHQFTGLLSAIASLLANAQRRVSFPESGAQYVFEIVKEIVIARPLIQVFIPLTRVIEAFGMYPCFTKQLCKRSKESSCKVLQNVLYFKQDACILEVYLRQLKHFNMDPITTIKITNALVFFVHTMICKESIMDIRKSEYSSCVELLQFILKLLCDCLTVEVESLKLLAGDKVRRPSLMLTWEKSVSKDWLKLDDSFWQDLHFLQVTALKRGLLFFNFLMSNETTVSQKVDGEPKLSTLLEEIQTVKGIELRENERAAMRDLQNRLKQYTQATNRVVSDKQESLEMQLSMYRKR